MNKDIVWAIYTPFADRLRVDTFGLTRQESIGKATGFKDQSKRWKYLYRQGFRAKKVTTLYGNCN